MEIAANMDKLSDEIQTSYDMRIRELVELTGNLHKTLKAFEKERIRDFNTLMSNVKASQAERDKEVHLLLQGFSTERKKIAAELEKMAASWNNLSGTMCRKRNSNSSRSRAKETRV
ncbi:MAG: hypothetical protein HZA08_07520 [Nitrospirae bacterium]|nr:hypothetical protein [Nitrospirota bacterium]